MLDGRVDTLMNGGVMVSSLGHEVRDDFLGLVHCDEELDRKLTRLLVSNHHQHV